MYKVVGIRFKVAGKIYYFDPVDIKVDTGEEVIVETSRGIEFGKVAVGEKYIPKNQIKSTLKPIIRIANDMDKATYEQNTQNAQEAFNVCNNLISEHNLDMKLISCEYTFDCGKLIFSFTSDNRIDFRDLVKELARIYRTRIELRQVGIRDHAKLFDTLGSCGYKTCCSKWAGGFDTVTIKMAKDQNLSLNSIKISGVCGRLMCCLKYEHDNYKKSKKNMPKIGEIAEIDEELYVVSSIDLLQEQVKVRKILSEIDEDKIKKIMSFGSIAAIEKSEYELDEKIEVYEKNKITKILKFNKKGCACPIKNNANYDDENMCDLVKLEK